MWAIHVTIGQERSGAWLKMIARDFDGTPTNVILIKDPAQAKQFATAAECDEYLTQVGEAFAVLKVQALSQSKEVS